MCKTSVVMCSLICNFLPLGCLDVIRPLVELGPVVAQVFDALAAAGALGGTGIVETADALDGVLILTEAVDLEPVGASAAVSFLDGCEVLTSQLLAVPETVHERMY